MAHPMRYAPTMTAKPTVDGLAARAQTLRQAKPAQVEIRWPKGWDEGDLSLLAVRIYGALGGDELPAWEGSAGPGRTGGASRVAANGDGVLSSSGDYGAVQGDAVITWYSVVHGDVLVSTHHISDCTMTNLTIDVHAPPAKAEKIAAIVRGLLPAA